jgi:GNAT superfamily N-acetyltransferase
MKMGGEIYKFRHALPEDVPKAIALRKKLFAETGVLGAAFIHGADEKLLGIYKDGYEAGEIVHYFAETEDGDIAAVAGALLKRDFPYLFFEPGYYGWIIDVYTEPPHRGRALAARLIALTHEWLLSMGAREAKLISAGADARRLYERLGYRSTWEMSHNLSGEPTYNEFIDAHSN